MSAGRLGSARIAILTIIDEEFAAVASVFNTGQNINGSPYFVELLNASQAYNVVVRMASGRGNHPAGEAIKDYIEDLRPEIFLLVGIAGGIENRDNTTLGDVVVADFVSWSEFQKLDQGKVLPRFIPYDHPSGYLRQTFVDPARMENLWTQRVTIRRPILTAAAPKVIVGHIVAGEKLLGDPTNEYQKGILDHFDNAIAVDMESMGVGRAVFAARRTSSYNPIYLVIRGISDLTNIESNAAQRREWKAYAGHVAAVFAKELTDRIMAVANQTSEPRTSQFQNGIVASGSSRGTIRKRIWRFIELRILRRSP